MNVLHIYNSVVLEYIYFYLGYVGTKCIHPLSVVCTGGVIQSDVWDRHKFRLTHVVQFQGFRMKKLSFGHCPHAACLL